jgi:putative spermidine/putrescine transport system substrate-binding protein
MFTKPLSLALSFSVLLCACGKKEADKQPAPAPGTETTPAAGTEPGAGDATAREVPGEGRLDILAWPGYIERGETDKQYDWVTPFEKATGCQVNVKTAGSSDEMVSLMNQGGVDLVTASGDASLRLIAGKKVQPIDLVRIPPYKKLDKRLMNAPWYTVDGKHYGVPYQWGPNVLMYNTNVFKAAPDSWAVVFEPSIFPDGKPNKGRIQAFDGPIYIADAALYLKSKDPTLGITDPYELNQRQYDAALALLRQQKQLVHRYWHDATLQTQDFTNEGVVASSSWPFQVNTLKANGQPIAFTIPKEGATGWADTTMMHVDAKHPNCAYKWMTWSLSLKVQGDVAAWFGSLPVMPKACQTNALLGPDGCQKNGWDMFDKIAFWRTPVRDCASQQGQCVPYSQWSTDYIAIMGGQ